MEQMGDQEQEDASASCPREPVSNDSYEELCSQLAQKDRDLVLAAELGKALLESNQELQRRYDTMSEEYSLKLESLQQEKYNLHLEFEKSETEHQNKLKDLSDDITTLREQLKSATQHQQDSETDTSRALIEVKQKSDYLAEQVQQASKREEELQRDLLDERAQNETHLCVIQDHLEHIAMLREQVEYLSEKLKEASEALLEAQQERDQLLQMRQEDHWKLRSFEDTVEEQEETIRNKDDLIQQLQSKLCAKTKKTSSSGKQHSSKHAATTATATVIPEQLQGSKVKGRGCKPEPSQPLCYSETIRSSSQLIPSSMIAPDAADDTDAVIGLFPDEQQVAAGIQQESLLSEFSMTPHHCRHRSDCSVASISEGSRKRHHKTIEGDSDDEAESSDKSSKSSIHKQKTLYPESMDCSNNSSNVGNFICATSSKHSAVAKSNLPVDLDNSSPFHQSLPTRSDFLTPPPEPVAEPSHVDTAVLSNYSLSSSPLTPPDDEEDVIDNHLRYSQDCYQDRRRSQSPMTRGTSLFEELSLKLSDLNRQNSEASEKSLFDELSHQMTQEEGCKSDTVMTSCLLGHPDFCHQSEGPEGGVAQGPRRSEDESSYTCEWPLLTSVSADMLDADDFECDDDDFLVGNVAGSTLSIGDSGVGIMLAPFSSKAESIDAVGAASLKSHSPHLWADRVETENAGKKDLWEACRLMRDVVDRLQGQVDGIQELSSPETDQLPECKIPEEGVEEEEASFENLLSLIKKARQFVDDMEHGGVSQLKKFSARQWQMEAMEPVMEEFKIPDMEHTEQRVVSSRTEDKLPHWSIKKEATRKTDSSSSFFLRRSL